MPIIKLTHDDLNEMIRRTVRSILSESVEEDMGSAMGEKDDVIEELVEYIKDKWEEIKASGQKPINTGTFSAKVGKGSGTINNYVILAPYEITEKLGIADKFDLNIEINDYQVSEKLLNLFGTNERGTEGTTYHGKDKDGIFYGEFSEPTMRIKRSRIDLFVPAINGELQVDGLYSTIYHELNHNFASLSIKSQKVGKTDKSGNPINVDDLHPISMSQRANASPHFTVQRALNPDPMADFLDSITYGPEREKYRMLNFLFYALWETTERNARAEEMYGSLQALKATRANFKDVYPQTTTYRNLKEYSGMLDVLKNVPETSNIWLHAANVMNMKPNDNRHKNKDKSFGQSAKERFIKHTKELLNKLYRKAMKVAEYYFQRQEEKEKKKADKPGGGLGRLAQMMNDD